MPIPAAQSPAPDHVLLLLLDGVGLPQSQSLQDSIYADFPGLVHLFSAHTVPLDACLGVPGIPQSATGQTAILTGINAPARVGSHVQGFPTAPLRRLAATANIFSRLAARGIASTFANAYVRFPGPSLPLKLRSVTTVATLAAFGRTRDRNAMLRGEAVYHDLTRRTLRERGFADVPEITEEEAARDLWRVARQVRFCLFEFFLTDRTAHRGPLEEQRAVLHSLDIFLTALAARLRPDRELLLVVSDHGNIEDPTRRTHTFNPVPWIAVGKGAAAAQSACRDLTQVTPHIVSLLAGATTAGNPRSFTDPSFVRPERKPGARIPARR